MKKYLFNRSQKGFTLAEIIVSSVISALVLTLSYSLVNNIIRSNKSDEASLKLSGKIDTTLDFVIDEINSSKKIIIKNSSIDKNCLINGEFLMGLVIPDQAKDNQSYKDITPKSWEKVDCPIVYYLQKDQKHNSYNLVRNGPEINEKGYYIPSKFVQSLIADGISNSPLDIMPCDTSKGWQQKSVKGIILCIDKRQKAAEIGISAKGGFSSITQSSGGYTRIQDDELIGDIGSSYFPGLGEGGACLDPQKCCIFGVPPCVNDDVTFFIDVSGSMRGGRIGKPPKSYLDAAKKTVIESIKSLKPGTKLNVVAFHSWETFLWPGGPQEINSTTRYQAINWVQNLQAGGGTDPWGGLIKTVKDKRVKEIFILSDGYTSTEGQCEGRYQNYADCIKTINDTKRPDEPVTINSISIGQNLCGSGGGWMGDLAKKNGGKCSVVR